MMATLCQFKKANLPVFYLIGGPASGKNTQAEKMQLKFGYTVVNVGKLLREEAKSGSCRGNKIREALQIGDMAPQDATLDILRDALNKAVCGAKPVLIVGFPRSACQRKTFEKEIGEPRATVFLDVSDYTMKKRQQARGRCSDRAEVISKRVDVFGQQTRPMIDDMISSGRVIKIDGEPQADQVFCAISKAMQCQNSQLPPPVRATLNTSTVESSVAAKRAGSKCGQADCDCNIPVPSQPCQPQPRQQSLPQPCGNTTAQAANCPDGTNQPASRQQSDP